MKIYESQNFENERALYGSNGIIVRSCSFDGPADGESALKESKNVTAENSYFNLRYPFWHNDGLVIDNCNLTDKCRAALWYSRNVKIKGSLLHGIKALRECHDVSIADCDVVSPEFGWSSHSIDMTNSTAESEYFMMRATALRLNKVTFKGKYSFQYVEDAEITNCNFDTKDAFWHAKNVTVRDSVVKGEYLAWYCENVTFINCKISGTQPFCYCKNLMLVNCEMTDADLCFERSTVHATLTAPLISVKNVYSGRIELPSCGEIIREYPECKGEIVFTDKK